MKEVENRQNNAFELPAVENISTDVLKRHVCDLNNVLVTSISFFPIEEQVQLQETPEMLAVLEGLNEAFETDFEGAVTASVGKKVDIRKPVNSELEKKYLKDSAIALKMIEDKANAMLDQDECRDAYLKAANDDLRKAYEIRQKAIREEEAASKAVEEAKANLDQKEMINETVYNPFGMSRSIAFSKEDLEKAEETLKEKQEARKQAEEEYAFAERLASYDAYEGYKEKTKQFLRAYSLNEMRRTLDGSTLPFLIDKNAYFYTAKLHQGFDNTSIHENLIYKVAKGEKDLPMHDLIIESDAHTQTLVDYWKDKQQGRMTPEKEQQIRTRLYEQILKMERYSAKFSETALDPVKNKAFHEAGFTASNNEPFEMSKYSNRGLWYFDAAIEAHKTGLENNWQIDDFGSLVAFNISLRDINDSARYKKSLTNSGFERIDPPDYGSPEKEAWANKANALYAKINQTPLQDNRQRNELLGQMRDLMAEGCQKQILPQSHGESFNRAYQKSIARNKLIEAGKEEAVCYEIPVAAELTKEEEMDLRQDFVKEPDNLYWGLQSAVKSKLDLPAVDEISTEGELARRIYDASEKTRTLSSASGSGFFSVHKVEDRKAVGEFRKKTLEVVDQWDDAIRAALPDHPLAQKMEAVVKATTTNRLRRSCEGFTNQYMFHRFPIFNGLNSLIADVGIVLDDKLAVRMEACKDSFPVFDIIQQGDEHIQTQVDYIKEREKNTLTPESREEFRQKLYLQSVSLLSKVRRLSDTVMNNRPEAERLHKAGVTEADPFQLGKYSPRGCLALEAGLEAQVFGLGNGWAVEDLQAIAAFNYMRQRSRMDCEYDRKTTYAAFKKYDPPRYPSKECEQYYDRMDAAYEEFKKTPLQSKEDRVRILSNMQKLLVEGMSKNYIDGELAGRNAVELMRNARSRDKDIAMGKERAVFEPLKDHAPVFAAAEIEGKKAFETKKGLFSRGESDEHKALRESYEQLKRVKKELTLPLSGEKMREYLEKIDLIEYNSQIYQKEKKGAHSDAGKARLEGAKKLEKFAVKERARFMELLNRDKMPKDRLSLNQFRKLHTKEQGEKALQELGNMEKLPAKGPERDRAVSLIADSLVLQLSESKLKGTARAFETKGNTVMKQEILKNDAFKKMAGSYLNGKTSGAKLMEDLKSGKCVQKIAKLQNRMAEEQNAKDKAMDQIRVKPKKAKAPAK